MQPARPAALGALLPLVLVAACGAPAREPPAPDVLVVVLDTVRADRLSAYGHWRPTSPHLAALARSGVRFADVTAPANWTWPSHASIFTGLPPWVHGAHFGDGEGGVRFAWGPAATAMRADLPTLAERLADAGYRTAFLTANGVLAPQLAGSLLRGFETAVHVKGGDRHVQSRLRALLSRDDPRPLFAFVNLVGAHGPYLAHDDAWLAPLRPLMRPRSAPQWIHPFLLANEAGITLWNEAGPGRRFWAREILDGRATLPARLLPVLRAAYDSDVAEVDAVLGRLLDTWRFRRSEDSVIAVTSDHGELLGEHGLVSHTVTVYPEVLRVPLVISAPGRLPEGRVVDTPVELQDLEPTLLELALGAPEPGSLLPLLEGNPGRTPIRAQALPRSDARSERLGRRARSCRWADEVVVVVEGAPAELYDLADDPGMERDRAGERAGRAGELAERCRASFADAVDAGTAPVEVPEELRATLRELGYVDEPAAGEAAGAGEPR
jgi:arylsulfatase A-like enzyme